MWCNFLIFLILLCEAKWSLYGHCTKYDQNMVLQYCLSPIMMSYLEEERERVASREVICNVLYCTVMGTVCFRLIHPRYIIMSFTMLMAAMGTITKLALGQILLKLNLEIYFGEEASFYYSRYSLLGPSRGHINHKNTSTRLFSPHTLHTLHWLI